MQKYSRILTYYKALNTLRPSKFIDFATRNIISHNILILEEIIEQVQVSTARIREVFEETKKVGEQDAASIKKLLKERDDAIDEIMQKQYKVEGIKTFVHKMDFYRGNTQQDFNYRNAIAELEGTFITEK